MRITPSLLVSRSGAVLLLAACSAGHGSGATSADGGADGRRGRDGRSGRGHRGPGLRHRSRGRWVPTPLEGAPPASMNPTLRLVGREMLALPAGNKAGAFLDPCALVWRKAADPGDESGQPLADSDTGLLYFSYNWSTRSVFSFFDPRKNLWRALSLPGKPDVSWVLQPFAVGDRGSSCGGPGPTSLTAGGPTTSRTPRGSGTTSRPTAGSPPARQHAGRAVRAGDGLDRQADLHLGRATAGRRRLLGRPSGAGLPRLLPRPVPLRRTARSTIRRATSGPPSATWGRPAPAATRPWCGPASGPPVGRRRPHRRLPLRSPDRHLVADEPSPATGSDPAIGRISAEALGRRLIAGDQIYDPELDR
jgi:hypothetical protein